MGQRSVLRLDKRAPCRLDAAGRDVALAGNWRSSGRWFGRWREGRPGDLELVVEVDDVCVCVWVVFGRRIGCT